MRLTLSRSSGLFTFVFGRRGGWFMEGFPEPASNRIPLGLFAILLVCVTFLRVLSGFFLAIFAVGLRVIGFLVDGSYVQGSILSGAKIIKIEPWPIFRGKRFPPFVLFAVAGAGLLYRYIGLRDAGEFVALCVLVAVVFYYIDPNEKSPAEQFAERVGPMMDQELTLAYYREPKFFPAIHLTD